MASPVGSWLWTLFVAAVLCAGLFSLAHAGKRVALVVGNSA